MTEPRKQDTPPPFQQAVERKAKRKQSAQKHRGAPLWSHFGVFGLVGWSVAIPTLLAIAAGIWLDRHTSSRLSWTLTLLPVGVVLGCINAWRWISFEERQIHRNGAEPPEETPHEDR